MHTYISTYASLLLAAARTPRREGKDAHTMPTPTTARTRPDRTKAFWSAEVERVKLGDLRRHCVVTSDEGDERASLEEEVSVPWISWNNECIYTMASSSSLLSSNFASLKRRFVYEPSGAFSRRENTVCSNASSPLEGPKQVACVGTWQKPLSRKRGLTMNRKASLSQSISTRISVCVSPARLALYPKIIP